MNRDEYVQKLKQQLDEWNGEVAKWEAKTREAQASLRKARRLSATLLTRPPTCAPT